MNIISNLLCARVYNFNLVFAYLFKVAYLTFYESVRPILLHFKLHDLYLCSHLICELYFQFIRISVYYFIVLN